MLNHMTAVFAQDNATQRKIYMIIQLYNESLANSQETIPHKSQLFTLERFLETLKNDRP